MKLLFIDTETTGTDPEKHGLIQMAGSVVIDGKIIEKFDLKIQPFPKDEMDDTALEVNGVTREQLATCQKPLEAYRAFQSLLQRHCDKYDRKDKFWFVAFNADFDADFVRKFFEKNNDVYFGSWFWSPILDVAKLAGVRLMEKRHQMVNFKLLTVAATLGLDVDPTKAHDADYDIDLTMRVFKLCIQDLAFLEVQMET